MFSIYICFKHIYQEAKKSVEFKSLPNIIFFQLMRFQFDLQTKRNEKINDRFEFFENIDLTDFFVGENSKKKSTSKQKTIKYKLQAVLVHSGTAQGGHYVVFINPKLDGNWIKFNSRRQV